MVQEFHSTHSCRVDSSTTTLWSGPFPLAGCLVSSLLLLCFIEIPVVNANSIDTDQMPYSAASDLSLHRLPNTLDGGLQTKMG